MSSVVGQSRFPTIVLCTLCLNEMEWLPKLVEQHKDWPGSIGWVFVEAADVMYAKANPSMVTNDGLSIDGTTEYLEELSKDPHFTHVKYGWTCHSDPAQGKCLARQQYMSHVSRLSPEYFLTLDADEFYCRADQTRIMSECLQVKSCRGGGCAQPEGFTFRYRNIWRPPSIVDRPLMELEVKGPFWRVLVCKFWRYAPGVHYAGNHNSPCLANGRPMNRRLQRFDVRNGTPEFIHTGFASSRQHRLAKNRYYVERGEGRTDHRGSYVQSRAAFESWTPGASLPNGDIVLPYTGPVPECFQ
jgi:hypothetical protein